MNDFRMGQHEEAIRQLQRDVNAIRLDTRLILDALAQQKGEKRSVAKIAAVIGAAGGTLSTMLFKVVMTKLGVPV
jgi:hypothetical protein